MASMLPFLRFSSVLERAEPDALFGFSLPFLPDMLTSRWLSGSDERDRLHQALRLQQRLVSEFWASGITGWDLRFIGIDELPGVAIGLLCRLRRPPQLPHAQFHEHCLSRARFVQQLFADFGYELLPLSDEASLIRYLTPFSFQALGEIRKHEEVLTFENTYNEFEVYVTYPWQWAAQTRLRLFETLLHRQSNCLVSIYLEPTQLSPQEQSHLHHATSGQVYDLLRDVGPQGGTVYSIYKEYVRTLRQPYLVRISLAASTHAMLQQIGRMFQDELHASQPLGTTEYAYGQHSTSGTGPRLTSPQNAQEWQWACRSLFNLEWYPWGQQHGAAHPGTARLRFLVDDVGASMPFRLPVAHAGDIPGVPIRSLSPSSGTPPPSAATPTFPSADRQSSIPTPRTPRDLVGQVLGSCKLEELIGQGGFGAVYRAIQPHLNRQVAVKVVLATISNEDRQKQRKMVLRFDREAQAIARLDHPHILGLFEYQPEPLPYIVMPYMAGGSLADEMKASGRRPLPISGVQTILTQVAAALDYAHQQRLVHRDMKPDNLLRHQDGRILLSDFGIVQFEDDDLTALTTDKQSSPYTPSYASPEQHKGLPVDYRTDIYSLGVIVYELLCGHRPFTQALGHVFTPPPPLETFGVRVPPAVQAVVIKAMTKEKEQRYQSAGEMARDFHRVAQAI